MQSDGAAARNISHHAAADSYPSWSADGRRLAFVSDRGGQTDIWVMNVEDPATAVNLTKDAAEDGYPAWSPDGTRIAFRSNRAGTRSVFVMGVDGSNVVNLTNHATEEARQWSRTLLPTAVTCGDAEIREQRPPALSASGRELVVEVVDEEGAILAREKLHCSRTRIAAWRLVLEAPSGLPDRRSPTFARPRVGRGRVVYR